MLKGIPSILSPQLLQILMEMGHGDEIVISDGNFPADSHAQRLVRADGNDVPALLEAILKFFPIDTFVPEVACVMQPVDPGTPEPPIWSEFRTLLSEAEGRPVPLTLIERHAFYEQARSAYAIVASSERALYANIILKKGVVIED